jgi:hypothetical protein
VIVRRDEHEMRRPMWFAASTPESPGMWTSRKQISG